MSVPRRLGFKKIVNGAGHFTKYGGSCPDPRVVKAMVEVSSQWVDMAGLEMKAGQMLSSLLRCEDAIVTAGAYSSNLIAACTALETAKQNGRNVRTPNIVIQKSHVTKYAEAFRTNGIELKQISRKSDSDLLESYIDESTIAVAYVLNEFDLEFSLQECVKTCGERSLPVLVDAALVDPPVRGIREVLNYGPDLVAVSGGKGFNGPNSSGLLIGKSGPISLARSLAFPNYGPGRPMKVSKEEIVGLVAAVEIASQQGDKPIEEWQKRVGQIQDSLAGLDSVRTEVFFPWKLNFPQPIPRLVVYVETGDGDAMAEAVRQGLERHDPPVWTRPPGDVVEAKNTIVIDVRTLDKADVRLLAESLKVELKKVISTQLRARA